MERKTLMNVSYLDILYNNKNKQYGGYELRLHYPQRLRNAMLMVLGICVTLSVLTTIHRHSSAHGLPKIPPPITIADIQPPPVQKIIIPPPPTAPPPAIHNTFTITPPKIVDNNTKIDDPVTTVNDTRNPGLSNTNKDPNTLAPGIVSTTTSTSATTNTAKEDKPVLWVAQMPEFDGDLAKYINSNIHYPELARENNIQGQVAIQFIVNEDGSVSNAKIMRGIGGGCDEEAIRIVSNMPKWKPGKSNGRAVKVYYNLPIKFVLQ